jgi:type I restriction enzyme, S subunit
MTMAPWTTTRIDQVCEVTSSKRIFAADYVSEGVPFYRAKEIGERHHGSINVSTELFITRSKFEGIRSKFGVPNAGDLLLTSIGALLGLPYVVKRGEEFYFKDGNLTWFRNFDGIESQFLYYWMLSPVGKGELEKSKIGSAQPAFTISLLKQMEIKLPTLAVQRRIAGMLLAYDDLIEKNTRRIAILEQMAQMVYREWFVDFRFPDHKKAKMINSEIGSIPTGWVAGTLGDFAEFVGRGISPIYDNTANCLVINQKCIRDGKLNLTPARRQAKKVPQEKMVKEGDILINSTGVGTLGRVAQVLETIPNCTVDSHVSIVRPKEHAEFFGRTLLELEDYFTAQGVGSTGQTELSRERIASTQVLVPPADLTTRFCKIAAPMNKMVVCCLKQNANLRRTRGLLLPKLISGEVSVEQLESEAIAQNA